MQLAGKIAVVTGAGRGIGREISLTLGSEGADVILAARSVETLEQVSRELESIGRRSLVVATDLRDPDSIGRLADQTLKTFGCVDVLINNAGISGPNVPLWQVGLKDWEETIAVNVTGTYLCCRAFLPSMIERRSGAIVIVGSMTGKRPLANRSAYATSKMALVGLTRTLATEVGPYGIRVNLISPGGVTGERYLKFLEKQAESRGISVEQAKEDFESMSPLRRAVDTKQVANAVLFLVSDAAGAITGEDLNVNTGTYMG